MPLLVTDPTGHIDMESPTLLYRHGQHAIYWLGIDAQTAFRCNSYLLCDGEQVILIDPGSRAFFRQVTDRVAQIMTPDKVTDLLLCHQDPDVAASMVDWLAFKPGLRVITSPRAHVLLPHYGSSDFAWLDIEKHPQMQLASGSSLQFITAPFLHSPAAFVTYDSVSRTLFSGDIWAALSTRWQLLVSDFAAHRLNMDLFHMDYMASNTACRGFTDKLAPLAIDAILPQHGSIIAGEQVAEAIDYLRQLQCGTDIAYPGL